MILAYRLLEVVTGLPFADLLARDVYTPVGMTDSSTSAEQTILRSTAVGHFPDPETMLLRPTTMFTLPETWGPVAAPRSAPSPTCSPSAAPTSRAASPHRVRASCPPSRPR